MTIFAVERTRMSLLFHYVWKNFPGHTLSVGALALLKTSAFEGCLSTMD